MNELMKRLITKPSVHVIAKTEFDEAGLDAWMAMRGFEDSPDYLTSPIYALRSDASRNSDEQDQSEQIAEFAGRFCYDSFLKGRGSEEYLANVLTMKHGSILEHVNYTLAIQGVSRALSHELVRHRAGFAISQESQRYVDAADVKFVVPPILLDLWGNDIECGEAKLFFDHSMASLAAYEIWQTYIVDSLNEKDTLAGIKHQTMNKKRANEAARCKLPNECETKLTWTGNLRSLRHFCELRGDQSADLEIRRLAAVITELMIDRAPYVFTDAMVVEGDYGVATTEFLHSKV